MVQNEFNVPAASTFPASFTVVTPIVKVAKVDGVFSTYKITWPTQTGALGYEVYGSLNPANNGTKLHPGTLSAVTTEFLFQLPITPPTDAIVHFWVRAVFIGNVKVLIQVDGATLFNEIDPFSSDLNPLNLEYSQCVIDNDYMRYLAAEMRNRTRAMLENDGEKFDLYWRRWVGNPCPCSVPSMGPSLVGKNDPDISRDPDYDSVTRCDDCFGTGVLAGFYPKMEVLIRYRDMPLRKIQIQKMSLDIVHDFNSFMLWLPKIHEHDILVRHLTKERFVVKDSKHSEWRGIPMHQEMDLLHVPDGDIRQLVTNDTISTADLKANQFDIARYGFSVFQ